MFIKLAGLSLAAIGCSALATLSDTIGLPDGSPLGALGLGGFLVYWVCKQYVKEREAAKKDRDDAAAAHRAERTELVAALQKKEEANDKLVRQAIVAANRIASALDSRPCLHGHVNLDAEGAPAEGRL